MSATQHRDHATVRRAPTENPRCVELVLGFDNGNVLAVEHIPFGLGYTFSEVRGADAATTRDLAEIPPFLRGDSEATYALVPDGAELVHRLGERTIARAELLATGALVDSAGAVAMSEIAVPSEGVLHVRLAGLAWSVRAVERGMAPAKSAIRLAPHRWTAASAAVHGVMLASLLFAPPATRGLCMDSLTRDDLRLVKVALLAAERDLPEPEPVSGDSGRDGQKHAGAEGTAGKEDAPHTDNRGGVKNRHATPALPQEIDKGSVANAGILGVLARAATGIDAVSSPYGSGLPSGYDDADALGALLGAQLGANAGNSGLGMRNAGRGGGGDGLGTIGLGKLGTIGAYGSGGDRAGYGAGVGKIGGRTATVPRIRPGSGAEVLGGLSKETIRRVIQRHLNEVRFCYEQGLSGQPDLAGRVQVRFVIAPSGAVSASQVESSTLAAPDTESCIRDSVRRWAFPAPESGGVVVVSYPFLLESAG